MASVFKLLHDPSTPMRPMPWRWGWGWRLQGAANLDVRAPEGQVWLCVVCGRTRKVPNDLGDTSCILHSVLCYEQNQGPMHWVAVPDEDEED
jgi:hypothetical protein